MIFLASSLRTTGEDACCCAITNELNVRSSGNRNLYAPAPARRAVQRRIIGSSHLFAELLGRRLARFLVSFCPASFPGPKPQQNQFRKELASRSYCGCPPSLAFSARKHSSYASALVQRCPVIPGHPLRGVGRQFPGMALQLRQVIERVGAT